MVHRLVLFDPDWNPASDKQAAARIWREGQKRRCFIYRFMSTGSIEEKIIQRQLSKEGLADIVDDKEQVNQFSSDELRDLFSLRQDTASDTHDTLRCKRCSSVKVREASKKGGKAATLTAAQADGCAQFLDAFVLHLQQEAATHIAKQLKSGTPPAQIPSGINPASPETITLPFAGEIEALKETLHSGGFASLPVYSKAQREVMQAIDDTLQQARQHKPPVADVAVTAPEADGGTADGGGNGGGGAVQSEEDKAEAAMIALYMLLFPNSFSIFGEFLNRWVEAVPGLTLLAKASKSTSSGNLAGAAAAATDGDGDAADEALEGEFVEQEGCPDDTDFNRWSHHCGVTSCDDELLSRALADDNTVSFVFGLEVNWSLLESREAALREENELRKEQQRLDLEALNEQRRLQREGKLVAKKPTNKGDDGSGSDSDGGDRGNGSAAKPEPSSKKAPKKAPAEKKRKRSSEGADAEGSADAVTHPTKKAAKAAPKDSSPEGGKRSSTHLSPAAVASAAAAASAPAPVVTTSRRTAQIALVNPLKEIDETFRADWEYLRRTHAKGKLDLAVFPAVLKQLKQFNNNWRVVPGDYSRSAPGEVMWTRLPGLKAETCANYRAGFDYFVNEAQLRKFICAQATLLGDSALAAPLSAEEVSVSAAVKEAAPRPTVPASTSSSAKVSAAVTSKRGRIQSDSESGSDVEEDEVAIVASVKKAKVTVEDINFSDSSDESIVGDRGGSSRKASPGTVAGAAAVTAMVRPPNRRVIADDDDEEENKAEAKEEEAKVLVPVAPAAPRPHQAAKPPTATSVSATTRKATPAKTPKKPTAAAAATSGSASSSAVFDLTTPTPPTPKAVSISASKPQPLRGSNQKENAPPNAADSHGPSVSKSSLSSSSGGGGLLSKARSSSSAAAAVREKEEKDEEVQDWNTQRTADSQDSQQHSQEDDDDDVAHSLGAKSRNESGNISSGGNGNRNGSRSSSSQQSGDYGGASASTSASASATVWSCVACTLENETAKNPTECALCE